MMLRRQRLLRRQRGVAVITALLLTTLAISIVASLFWQQQVQVRSMENQRLHLQTKWILRGALDWATLVLRQDGYDNRYTSLNHAWATPLAETRLDQYIERERVEGEVFDATLSGNIIDANSRYNLTNLANAGQPIQAQEAIFGRLLQHLQLDPALAKRVARVVAEGQPVQPAAPPDGQPPGQPPAPAPGQPAGQPPGQPAAPVVRAQGTAPMPVLQVDDLLTVPGMKPEMLEKLRPFLIVLPEQTKLNVNTAPPELLASVVENMSVSEANALVVRRKQAPWQDINYFTAGLGAGKTLEPDTADTVSEYFLVQSRVRLDRAALDAESLINRKLGGLGIGAAGTRVVWIRQN
jgi:general secretion pathway protein K